MITLPGFIENSKVFVQYKRQNYLLSSKLLLGFFYRIREKNSAEIHFQSLEQSFLLVCQPSKEKRGTKIEIHRADCLPEHCVDDNMRNSKYTQLQIERGTTNQIMENKDYLDVIE